jgi:hypothetical protein
VRITAQLIDAVKGHHFWAEKYDRDTKGFFNLLDEITRKIGIALQVKLTYGEQAQNMASTETFEVWSYLDKAAGHF